MTVNMALPAQTAIVDGTLTTVSTIDADSANGWTQMSENMGTIGTYIVPVIMTLTFATLVSLAIVICLLIGKLIYSNSRASHAPKPVDKIQQALMEDVKFLPLAYKTACVSIGAPIGFIAFFVLSFVMMG